MTFKLESKSIKNAFQNPLCFFECFFMDFALQKHAPDLAKVWFSYRFLQVFHKIAFFDFDRHFDQKKLQKQVQNRFKIHQKRLPKFVVKNGCFFDRFLMDFDFQNGAKIIVAPSSGASWNRLWTGNTPRRAPDLILDAFLINFDRFVDEFGCFLDDFFKIFA